MKRGLPPQPRIVLANGKRPCRGCGAELPARRSSWCSDECKERHYMALSNHARHRVWMRDHGICAVCGVDCEFIKRIAWVLQRRGDGDAMWLVKVAWGFEGSSLGGPWFIPRTLWEADHVVPLVEGGTNDLENYRTLCIPCHRRVTAELAYRRSKAFVVDRERARQTELLPPEGEQ